jgi:small subunit ribosomal protein S17
MNDRRRIIGTVVSNKMTETVVVRVDRTVRHPLYGKVVHRSVKLVAQDGLRCQPGDRVRLVESRPLSKRKRWVVETILEHGAVIEVPLGAEDAGGAA